MKYQFSNMKSNQSKNTVLVYVHDPMCSWCWGFRPTLQKLVVSLPERLEVIRILGGLAPDSDLPMAEEMKQNLQHAWQSVQATIPGTEFNFDFWENCQPRRSTYPACRAVIAASLQSIDYDEKMTGAIQYAYYKEAKNPSDDSTLIELAQSIGVDAVVFERDLNSPATHNALAEQVDFSRQLGVQGFPSLLLITESSAVPIPVNYRDPGLMLQKIEANLVN
jgi:putative protein-disulfide isomerase